MGNSDDIDNTINEVKNLDLDDILSNIDSVEEGERIRNHVKKILGAVKNIKNFTQIEKNTLNTELKVGLLRNIHRIKPGAGKEEIKNALKKIDGHITNIREKIPHIFENIPYICSICSHPCDGKDELDTHRKKYHRYYFMASFPLYKALAVRFGESEVNKIIDKTRTPILLIIVLMIAENILGFSTLSYIIAFISSI